MWDDAFPSFLIGLREGLEAGLIVSILVATLVRADAKSRLPQVWTGVLAAIAMSMGFGAILTFTATNLSTKDQEAFGGTLSLIAVGFVTAMVFWMRRSARHLAGEIKQKVTAALAMGGGMLVLTSFLAVGREGLETALFLWTTGRAAGESSGPLIGAALGLVLAAGLCWGLYRRVLKINLTRFFGVTGIVLIVIASGVLGYGLRDLQEGGVLAGNTAYAFDLSAHIDAGSWYAALLQGVLNLTPAMTWLQVAGYVAYLAVVMPLFVRGVTRPAVQPKPQPQAAPEAVTPPRADPEAAEALPAAQSPAAEPAAAGADGSAPPAGAATDPATDAGAGQRTEPGAAEPAAAGAGRPVRNRPVWVLPAVAVVVPAVVAGLIVAFSDSKPAAAQTVSVSASECGKGFKAPKPGRQTFQMHNTGNKASEVYLINPASNAVYGEIEGLAPGTTRDLVATVGGGDYAWRCVPTSGKAVTSASVRVSGGGATKAVLPLSEAQLQPPLTAYRGYVDAGLATLEGQTAELRADIKANRTAAARSDWLAAHITYSSLGAAYGTFADFDSRINGRKDGLPGGVADKDFTGFHRIEYGLWHNQPLSSLQPYADHLVSDVTGLRKAFPKQDFDPSDLPLRTHEILENALQFELTGDTDEGSGTNLATADANLAGTKELLSVLRPLISERAPGQLATVDSDISRLQGLLDGARHGSTWTPVESLDPASRAKINGAMGQLLEDLAPIPDLLEIRKSA